MEKLLEVVQEILGIMGMIFLFIIGLAFFGGITTWFLCHWGVVILAVDPYYVILVFIFVALMSFFINIKLGDIGTCLAVLFYNRRRQSKA